MNFNISATTDHWQALRNFVSSGHTIDDRELLGVLYEEFQVPYESFMKQIIGMPHYGPREGLLRNFVKFGLFHTEPDYNLLDINTVTELSRRVLAKAYPDNLVGIQRTFLDGDQVTIYYQELGKVLQQSAYMQPCFTPVPVQARPMFSPAGRPRSVYKSPSEMVIETALVELVGSTNPVVKIGDLNCYTVTKDALDAAIAKRVVTYGAVGEYVELRNTLRHLCIDLEWLQNDIRLGKTLGEICNLIAAAYPDENWKSAITMKHITDQMRDLRLVFQNTPTHFSGRYNEDNCESFLVELFTDTRTEAELEAHELKISIDSAIGMFSNFGTVGDLYTIVIQDQPSTDE